MVKLLVIIFFLTVIQLFPASLSSRRHKQPSSALSHHHRFVIIFVVLLILHFTITATPHSKIINKVILPVECFISDQKADVWIPWGCSGRMRLNAERQLKGLISSFMHFILDGRGTEHTLTLKFLGSQNIKLDCCAFWFCLVRNKPFPSYFIMKNWQPSPCSF